MTLSDRVEAPTVRPVYVGLLDFKDEPVFGWTGPGLFAPTNTGDPDLDGNIFTSAEGAVDIGDFASDTGNGSGLTITFSAHDNDADVMRQVVRDRRSWKFRRAKIWRFFLDETQGAIYPEFTQMFAGVMTEVKFIRSASGPPSIEISMDQDIPMARGTEARWVNEPTGFSKFILDLANGPIGGGRRVDAPRGGAAGGNNGAVRGDGRDFKAL